MLASVSSCVPEVAIPRFCIAKISPPETYLLSLDTRGAYRYLATLANYYKEHARLAHAERL